MLKLDLHPLFNARGIKRGFTFLRKLGITSKVSTRLLDETKTVRLDHIYKICKELQCTPNDLIWLDGATDLPVYHPLQKLKERPENSLNLIEEIKGVPLDKLEDLKEVIDQLKNGSR